MHVSLFWAHLMTPTGSQNSSCDLGWFLPTAQQVSCRCLLSPAKQVSFRTLITQQPEKRKHNSNLTGFVAATQLSVVKVATNSN